MAISLTKTYLITIARLGSDTSAVVIREYDRFCRNVATFVSFAVHKVVTKNGKMRDCVCIQFCRSVVFQRMTHRLNAERTVCSLF